MSRRFAATSVTSRPSMRMAPSLTSSSPAMQRNSVVFPHPDGPTNTMNSPSSIVRSTPSTARVPLGNVFTTVCSSMPAIVARSALQSSCDDAARELLLQGKERQYSRQGEEQRGRKRHGYERDLLSLGVVPGRDLRAEGEELIGEKQGGVDVLAPPTGAEPQEGDDERGAGVREVDLQERP